MWEKVELYLKKHEMLAPGMTVLAGFSGGADSTALLQILWEYGKERGINVRALHVNHGIRGEEALRDQRFCEDFCQKRGIPLAVAEEDVPGFAAREGRSLEEAGRMLRYAAFGRELEAGRADRVALAHHQNDQAETMLFHLMRGTGLRGLRGMEPVRLPYIRPLLCVTRAEIEEWLRQEGIGWVEDTTNGELFCTRNRIRHQILAPMEEIRSGSTAHMAAAAERLLELEDYLKGQEEEAYRAAVRAEEGVYRISLEVFLKLHPMLQKLVALDCLEQLCGSRRDLGTVHAEQLCALAQGRTGSRVTLPGGCTASLGYGEITLKKDCGEKTLPEAAPLILPGETACGGYLFRCRVENREKNEEIPANRYTKWFDYDKIKNNLMLRGRQPGDYLRISGGGAKKLKDYLIDCKVPREERDGLVLLADGSHILWVVGMRISETYKVMEQTRRVLKIEAELFKRS